MPVRDETGNALYVDQPCAQLRGCDGSAGIEAPSRSCRCNSEYRKSSSGKPPGSQRLLWPACGEYSAGSLHSCWHLVSRPSQSAGSKLKRRDTLRTPHSALLLRLPRAGALPHRRASLSGSLWQRRGAKRSASRTSPMASLTLSRRSGPESGPVESTDRRSRNIRIVDGKSSLCGARYIGRPSQKNRRPAGSRAPWSEKSRGVKSTR